MGGWWPFFLSSFLTTSLFFPPLYLPTSLLWRMSDSQNRKRKAKESQEGTNPGNRRPHGCRAQPAAASREASHGLGGHTCSGLGGLSGSGFHHRKPEGSLEKCRAHLDSTFSCGAMKGSGLEGLRVAGTEAGGRGGRVLTEAPCERHTRHPPTHLNTQEDDCLPRPQAPGLP